MALSSQRKAQEILAILRAHHQLGAEYEEEMTEKILSLFSDQEQSLTHEDVTKYLASLPAKERRKIWKQTGESYRDHSHRNHVSGILVLSIPLLAIAGGMDHGLGLFAIVGLDALAIIVEFLRQ